MSYHLFKLIAQQSSSNSPVGRENNTALYRFINSKAPVSEKMPLDLWFDQVVCKRIVEPFANASLERYPIFCAWEMGTGQYPVEKFSIRLYTNCPVFLKLDPGIQRRLAILGSRFFSKSIILPLIKAIGVSQKTILLALAQHSPILKGSAARCFYMDRPLASTTDTDFVVMNITGSQLRRKLVSVFLTEAIKPSLVKMILHESQSIGTHFKIDTKTVVAVAQEMIELHIDEFESLFTYVPGGGIIHFNPLNKSGTKTLLSLGGNNPVDFIIHHSSKTYRPDTEFSFSITSLTVTQIHDYLSSLKPHLILGSSWQSEKGRPYLNDIDVHFLNQWLFRPSMASHGLSFRAIHQLSKQPLVYFTPIVALQLFDRLRTDIQELEGRGSYLSVKVKKWVQTVSLNDLQSQLVCIGKVQILWQMVFPFGDQKLQRKVKANILFGLKNAKFHYGGMGVSKYFSDALQIQPQSKWAFFSLTQALHFCDTFCRLARAKLNHPQDQSWKYFDAHFRTWLACKDRPEKLESVGPMITQFALIAGKKEAGLLVRHCVLDLKDMFLSHPTWVGQAKPKLREFILGAMTQSVTESRDRFSKIIESDYLFSLLKFSAQAGLGCHIDLTLNLLVRLNVVKSDQSFQQCGCLLKSYQMPRFNSWVHWVEWSLNRVSRLPSISTILQTNLKSIGQSLSWPGIEKCVKVPVTVSVDRLDAPVILQVRSLEWTSVPSSKVTVANVIPKKARKRHLPKRVTAPIGTGIVKKKNKPLPKIKRLSKMVEHWIGNTRSQQGFLDHSKTLVKFLQKYQTSLSQKKAVGYIGAKFIKAWVTRFPDTPVKQINSLFKALVPYFKNAPKLYLDTQLMCVGIFAKTQWTSSLRIFISLLADATKENEDRIIMRGLKPLLASSPPLEASHLERVLGKLMKYQDRIPPNLMAVLWLWVGQKASKEWTPKTVESWIRLSACLPRAGGSILTNKYTPILELVYGREMSNRQSKESVWDVVIESRLCSMVDLVCQSGNRTNNHLVVLLLANLSNQGLICDTLKIRHQMVCIKQGVSACKTIVEFVEYISPLEPTFEGGPPGVIWRALETYWQGPAPLKDLHALKLLQSQTCRFLKQSGPPTESAKTKWFLIASRVFLSTSASAINPQSNESKVPDHYWRIFAEFYRAIGWQGVPSSTPQYSDFFRFIYSHMVRIKPNRIGSDIVPVIGSILTLGVSSEPLRDVFFGVTPHRFLFKFASLPAGNQWVYDYIKGFCDQLIQKRTVVQASDCWKEAISALVRIDPKNKNDWQGWIWSCLTKIRSIEDQVLVDQLWQCTLTQVQKAQRVDFKAGLRASHIVFKGLVDISKAPMVYLSFLKPKLNSWKPNRKLGQAKKDLEGCLSLLIHRKILDSPSNFELIVSWVIKFELILAPKEMNALFFGVVDAFNADRFLKQGMTFCLYYYQLNCKRLSAQPLDLGPKALLSTLGKRKNKIKKSDQTTLFGLLLQFKISENDKAVVRAATLVQLRGWIKKWETFPCDVLFRSGAATQVLRKIEFAFSNSDSKRLEHVLLGCAKPLVRVVLEISRSDLRLRRTSKKKFVKSRYRDCLEAIVNILDMCGNEMVDTLISKVNVKQAIELRDVLLQVIQHNSKQIQQTKQTSKRLSVLDKSVLDKIFSSKLNPKPRLIEREAQRQKWSVKMANAIYSRRLDAVKQCIAEGMPVGFAMPRMYPFALMCAIKGWREGIELFLQHGLEIDFNVVNVYPPNKCVREGFLYFAIKHGHHELVSWLLELGATLVMRQTVKEKQLQSNSTDETSVSLIDPLTHFELIISGPNEKIHDPDRMMSILLKYLPKQSRNAWIDQIALRCIREDRVDLLKPVVYAGFGLGSQIDGCPPISYAVSAGSLKTAQYMLSQGCDLYESTTTGVTTLQSCISGLITSRNMNIEMFYWIIEVAKARALKSQEDAEFIKKWINSTENVSNYSALYFAAQLSVSEFSQKESWIDQEKMSGLVQHWKKMAKMPFSDILSAIIKLGADVDVVTCHGNRPLHRLAAVASAKTIRAFLKENPEVNVLNLFCLSPLHIACIRGNWSVIEVLLDAGADPTLLAFGLFSPIDIFNLVAPIYSKGLSGKLAKKFKKAIGDRINSIPVRTEQVTVDSLLTLGIASKPSNSSNDTVIKLDLSSLPGSNLQQLLGNGIRQKSNQVWLGDLMQYYYYMIDAQL